MSLFSPGLRGVDDLDDQAETIARLQQRLEAVGVDPELAEPRESLFSRTLNWLDKPKQAILGVADAALIRRDIGDVGFLGAVSRGFDERANFFDVLRRETTLRPSARAVLGLAGEIALDPLNLISGGSHKAVSKGSGAVTKFGIEKFDDTVEKALHYLPKSTPDEAFTSARAADESVNHLFRHLRTVHEDKLELDRIAKKFGSKADQSKVFRLKNRIENKVKELVNIQDGLGMSTDDIQDLLSVSDQIFKRPSIKLSTSIPFIGDRAAPVATDSLYNRAMRGFQDEAGELLKQEYGPVRKNVRGVIKEVFDVAGQVFRPKDIDIAEVEIPLSVHDAFKNARDAVGMRLSSINKFVDDGLKGAINAGGGLGASAHLAQAVKSGGEKLGRELGKAFSFRLAHGGTEEANVTSEFLSTKFATTAMADDSLKLLFGKTEDGKWLVEDEAMKPFFQEIGNQIDDIAGLSWRDYEANIKLAAKQSPELERHLNEALAAMEIARRKPEVGIEAVTDSLKILDSEVRKNSSRKYGIEDLFLVKLQERIDSGEVSEEVAGGIRRVTAAMSRLRDEEIAAGIESGFIDAYIPHIYKNIERVLDPTEARGHKDLADAFAHGKIGITDIRTLYRERHRVSLLARGKKKYFQRMAIERGVPVDKLKELYEEAKTNPDVAAMLKAEGFSAPTHRTFGDLIERLKAIQGEEGTRLGQKQQAIDLLKNSEYEELVRAHGDFNRFMDDFDGAVNDIERIVKEKGLIDQDMRHLQAKGEWDASRVVKVERVVDGEKVVEERILPTDIAKAVDEAANNRDILREMIPKGGAAEALLDAIDSATNIFKKAVTLPFPAYWSMNMLGDGFFRLADGGLSAIDPGGMALTMKMLDGTGEIVTPTGQVITSGVFRKLLRESGVTFSNDEFIDVLRATNNLDIDRQVAKARGIRKNLKMGEGSEFNPFIAFESAADVMRDHFENFFRVNHLVHKLKGGSSFTDAVRLTNDALIDYRKLTSAERSIARRFYMFYGWISKSSKRTLNQLMFQPGALQQQLKGAQSLAEVFSSPDAAPSYEEIDRRALASSIGNEQVTFDLGRGPTGEKIVGRGFGLPLNTLGQQFSVQLPRNLSVGEIVDAGFDSFSRTAQKQFATANPIIKGAAEAVTGRNLYFDRPLNAKFLRKVPSLEEAGRKIAGYSHDSIPSKVFGALDDMAQGFLDGVPDGKGSYIVDPGKFWILVNLVPGFSRVLATGRAFADERTSLGHGMLRGLTGVRIEGGDIGRTHQFAHLENIKDLSVDKALKEREVAAGLRDPETGKLIKKEDLL